ncbi:bifunctional methylenetetrahydrofolate dehydrogenase/methenyltetrahydrofolate cyclohydrolase FolD [Sanyastnella coralliicola]|uniref:bifunctional methylenetetrahydrofolate dehydrogenase/methenyltetrahydrofolate cyclohydrolase FolD n=1 Tax=Sanyastnella coralliicola TaxID=3069118 RepID=UPI0027B99324|nr:bifunctional methylenetetrahydrofolate dehydrogenase/methenyltetrahydrofolate cyclohydrolase FolD [Longitalea sp. SCSIO 12813]
MQILDGKATSKAIKEEIAVEVEKRKAAGLKTPHLAAVLVGDDGASQTYVNSKVRACERCGFKSTLVKRDGSCTEEELLEIVDQLNNDDDIDGFIVQLPLPKHINEQKVLEAVKREKDVDGFHPENVGRMALNLPTFLPATPYGIMQMLERYEVPTQGKHAVVIGRSHIVGSPMSILLSRNGYPGNCTVTITHSRTTNLEELTREADILIVALGRPEFVKADMVKEGAVIVDVGITRVEAPETEKGYVIKGDVAFDEVAPKSSFITPVPGGVGPMTIASLLKNTLQAAGDKPA